MSHLTVVVALVVALCLPTASQAQSSFSPPFMAQEGQLKDSDPPAWQLISMLRISGEADVNPRGNQLLSSLITFVNKRGQAASSLVLVVTAEEKHADLVNSMVGVVLEEASARSSAAVVERMKVSVSLKDPVTKSERSFELRKK